MTDTTNSTAVPGNEFVAFRINGQEFCVEIMSIREIRGWTQETILPHSPEFVRGVINLRGAILPIVDLADRLGLGATVPTERHVIVVAQLQEQIVGLLVEAVSDILTLDESAIQPTPDVASDLAKRFIRGAVSVDNRLISIVELTDVLPVVKAEAA